jgi:uncharacterized damage-inducible protein DinB
MNPENFRDALAREFRRRVLEESLSRIGRCLDELTDEDLWLRPNEASNSVGNLLLHLAGNVRQWIVSGLGGAPDRRDRPAEFAARGPVPRADLRRDLETAVRRAVEVVERLPAAALFEPRTVQGFTETGLSILVHVIEHFSYHTGQIVYFTKARKAIDLGFYRGVDLTRRNSGPPAPPPRA